MKDLMRKGVYYKDGEISHELTQLVSAVWGLSYKKRMSDLVAGYDYTSHGSPGRTSLHSSSIDEDMLSDFVSSEAEWYAEDEARNLARTIDNKTPVGKKFTLYIQKKGDMFKYADCQVGVNFEEEYHNALVEIEVLGKYDKNLSILLEEVGDAY